MSVFNANDCGERTPRMEVFQSMWGMTDIPHSEIEWTLEEKLYKIKRAGFSGIQYDLTFTDQDEYIKCMLEKLDMKLAIGCCISNTEELSLRAKRAKQLGVHFINVQVKDYFTIGDDAVRKIEGLYKVSDAEEIPLFIETHRGTMTQDLIRTVEYARSISRLRFTADLSHFVVAGEVHNLNDQLEKSFDEILRKTAVIHARVSNGEQVQVDIAQGNVPQLEYFKEWWRRSMEYWLETAEAGDVFPFVVELGPKPYSLIIPGDSKTGRYKEVSDRWQQALMIKGIAENIWNELQQSYKRII